MSEKPAEALGEPQAGFCSATCVDRGSLQEEIKQPPKTSDVFSTCNLPKRFDHPHWFNGYGCQKSNQHPLYRTSSSEYGWYPPDVYSISAAYFPKESQFTNGLMAAGMYRDESLNVGPIQIGVAKPC